MTRVRNRCFAWLGSACLLLLSSCALAPFEVFLSPNPSFDDQAGTAWQVRPQTQAQPALGFSEPATYTGSTVAEPDVSYIVNQIDEALAEATAHIYVGEARLQENNLLEAIREFELARQLVEQDIDPGLQYIRQVPKVQGGANILSDYRIQSMHTQRQAILERITTSYDFQTLYQRQYNQDRVTALRDQSKPVFRPLGVDAPQSGHAMTPLSEVRPPQIPNSDGYVMIDDLLLVVPVADVEWHLGRFRQHHVTFAGYLLRTQQYAPVVGPILARQGVPARLAYVGLIASGYQPAVKDTATGKVGLWQLTADVAGRYGLRVDANKDERQDIEASTTAFARYLRDLERRFGSWDLAILAYEIGEQELQRAINRAGAYNAEDVRQHLGASSPEGAFLPKLAAAILIAEDPEAFGFGLAGVSNSAGTGASSGLRPVNFELGEPPVSTILNQ